MAQNHADTSVGPEALTVDSNGQTQQSMWRRLFSSREKDNGTNGASTPTHKGHGDSSELPEDTKNGLGRRVSRKVVPGLPRTKTFKRQRSEVRSKLEPVRPTPAERRAVSMDRRTQPCSSAFTHADPRTSAPDFLHHCFSAAPSPPTYPASPIGAMMDSFGHLDGFELDGDSVTDGFSRFDVQSMTTSQYDALIDSELERIWILNLSMHFRDRSRREKFFVTYRQHEHLWRRVTISLDYRNAPENSLESELAEKNYQRDKSAKIYEAIRDSLPSIEFYDTVTNLKLETKEGRLHVHVVEDVNEIISYPPVRTIQHMNCRRVKEREIHFDSHMSGFVYKVRVHGRVLIKKEIPGPDNVDEFLYEINALDQLSSANNVIRFYGVVVDDREENVTGLLISYAARGALLDVIYDNDHSLPWPARAKWARQIVAGLSEIHEAGFVQGDFTLSNIVIDEHENAKIIDINRRGCPIGWEPPEATPLIDSNQRISMYIGVKSDLYQLGMVLWALATQEDDPENYGRPLKLGPEVDVPRWYRRIVDTCLCTNPRNRAQAFQLLSWFPEPDDDSQYGPPNGSSASFNDDDIDGYTINGISRPRTVHPPSDWAYVGWTSPRASSAVPDEPYYPARGRSPPSPMPSNLGGYGSSRYGHRMYTWSDTYNRAPTVPSVSDIPPTGLGRDSDAYLKESRESLGNYPDGPRWRGRAASRGNESLTDSAVSKTGETAQRNGRAQEPRAGRFEREPVSQQQLRSNEHIRNLDGLSSPRPIHSGKTGPDSQADSGKDLTDMASTPREHQGGSVFHERSGKSPATGESSNNRHNDGHGYDHGAEINGSSTSDLPFPPNPPVRASPGLGQPDDLKGVGSALTPPHGDGDVKRQGDITLDDDDLGLDLGSLRHAFAAVG